MEILLKLTDIKKTAEDSQPADAAAAIAEVAGILETDARRWNTLLQKGRKKIDLVGELCNIEITIKE